MKDKRFLIGVCVTAVWLTFAACMFFAREHPGKLNEWGDFFAGFFAPLAFLWLVLGIALLFLSVIVLVPTIFQ